MALLRFLEDHEFRPLGATRLKRSNVRVIAATHDGLRELAREGRFRQDLMFRLDVLSLKLPPLATRTGDVELLAYHFIRQYSRRYRRPAKTICQQALEWMTIYRWPGNVRELENAVHRALVVAEGPGLELRHFLEVDGGCVEPAAGEPALRERFSEAKTRVVERFERQYLNRLLLESGGNVTLAARRAGKERRAFGKLLKKHGIRCIRYTAVS